MQQPASGLLVKAYKEALRTVHQRGSIEDHVLHSDYVQQAKARMAQQQLAASVDPHRALAKFKRILLDGNLRAAWSARKQRVRERLQMAYAYASTVGISNRGAIDGAASSSVAARSSSEFSEMLESHPALRVRGPGAAPPALRHGCRASRCAHPARAGPAPHAARRPGRRGRCST